MIARYETLRHRIQMELVEMDRIQEAIQRHWQKVRTSPTDRDAYLNSVAFNLHGFYSGLERLFELIAIELDGGTLGGDSWHTELLKQMTLNVDGVRPAVLRPETAARLDEYRKFRHVVRNIYATNLDPVRIESLITGLSAFWKELRAELERFLRLLHKIALTNI